MQRTQVSFASAAEASRRFTPQRERAVRAGRVVEPPL